MKWIEMDGKLTSQIRTQVSFRFLPRFAIRLSKLIHRPLAHKKYYLKAPSLALRKTSVRYRLPALTLGKRGRLALIFVSVAVLIISLSALIIKQSPKTNLEAQAFNLQLSPAPLSSNYLYQNITNGFNVYLGNRLQETKPTVKFEQDNSSTEFSLAQLPDKNTEFENQDNKAVVYKNVFPGIDIKYYLMEKGVKEEIIVRNQESGIRNQEFKFNLNLKNAVPRKSLEGKVSTYFLDPIDGQYRFHIPQPFMVDAGGAKSTEVELQLVKQSDLQGSTSYGIIVIPSQEWLNHPARQYPVIIDPSVVHDESSEFSGTTNRIEDEGSGTSPKLRTPYHELPTDEHTAGLWHMNETVNDSCSGGKDACDSSGNDNHGTATGTTIETTNQKLGAAARSFNGSSDYIDMGNNASLQITGSFTFEAWAYPQDTSTQTTWGDPIINKENSGLGYQLTWHQDGKFGCMVSDGAASITWGNSGKPTNTWYHAACVYDGSNIRVYVNGILENSAADGYTKNTANNFQIGVFYGSRYYQGRVDEVRISDIARSPEEIRQDAQRFPYGVYTSDTIDLGAKVDTIDTIEWTDSITPPTGPSGWTKSKPVIIDNTQNSNTLTDYQVKVDVNYDSNMQSDFDDLRFRSSLLSSTYGNESDFNLANTNYTSVAALDATHFVVAYSDFGGAYYGCAKIGTVSDSTITYGNEYCFNEANTIFISAAALDSTHFVVGYKDLGGDTYGHAKVGTVSGSTISYGNEYPFNEAITEHVSTATLDSTHFVVGYQDTGDDTYGHVKVGTVSGPTISYGNESTFRFASADYISLTDLDSTHFVVGYRSNTYGRANVGTVSGTTITYGGEYTFHSSNTTEISVTSLDSTHFVVGYRDFVDTYGHAKVGTVTSTTITCGSKATFNSANTTSISASGLDSTHFVVGYNDVGGDTYGHARVGTVSGNAVSYGGESTFNSANSGSIAIDSLDSTHFVAAYWDAGGDSYSHTKIGTTSRTDLDYWIEEKADGAWAKVFF